MAIKNKLIIKTKEGIRCIDLNNVAYCEANGNYTNFVYIDSSSKFSTPLTLKAVGKMLPDNFIKCHRKYFINIKYIEEIKYNKIYINRDLSIDISSTRKCEVIEYLLNGRKPFNK